MTSSVGIGADQLAGSLPGLEIDDQGEMLAPREGHGVGCDNHSDVCAICLDKIVLQETALVIGCEHAYCVTCILQWATYKDNPTCPQCKHPFESLNIHRSLDGRIHDYMFQESVCLLLRATWFEPLVVEDHEPEDYDQYPYTYDDEEDDLDEVYFNFNGSSSLRIGNRRWGDNGYVRGGRQEARPVSRPNTLNSGGGSSRQPKRSNPVKDIQSSGSDSGAGSSGEPRKKDPVKDATGRRAKRALKREAADKAAAVKHQQHLARLGRM